MPPHLPRRLRGRRGPALLAAAAAAAGALAVTSIAANTLDVRNVALLSEPGNSHTHDPEAASPAAQFAYSRLVAADGVRRTSGARQLAPSDTGAWSPEIPSPLKGIHAILLPTGKILYFGNTDNFSQQGGAAQAFLYDPQTGLWEDVRPPNDPYSGKPFNLFCAGHAFLPDGRLVVAGGNQEWPNAATGKTYIGAKWIFTFNPYTKEWIRQPDMRKGRWYPTLSTLSDGRVVIMSGLDETGNTDTPRGISMNEDVEVFTPSADINGVGTVELKPSAQMYTQYYPHMFTLPGDRVLIAGQDSGDTKILDTDTWTWSEVPNIPDERLWSAAVFEPYDGQTGPRYITVNGGVDSPAPDSDGRTWRLDLQNIAAGWQAMPTMNRGRAHHNMQLLPDGSALVVGGGKGIGTSAEGRLYAGAVFTAELRRPDGTWLELPAQAQQRTYHSTTVLLPDGRVVSGGDDRNAFERPLEIYSPPYLYRGARPVITQAPAAVTFDETFRVDTPNAGQITKAVLVAPTSTTHSTDMNQRVIGLEVTPAGSAAVNLRAPKNVDFAPRGHYMLFLLNSQGIPSVASWVRLTDQTTPDPPAPPPPTAPGGGQGGSPSPGTPAAPAAPGTGAAPGTTATPRTTTRRPPPAIGVTRFQRIGRFLYLTTRVNIRGRVTIQLNGPPRRITLATRTVARPTTIRVRVRRVVRPGDTAVVRLVPRTGRPVLRIVGTRTTLKPVVAVRRK